MPQIMFLPSEKSIDVPPGTELLDAAREIRVEIESPCGGKGTCGKCIVKVISGEVDSDSLGVLPSAAVAEGYVLACKTRVLDTPVRIEVPEPSTREGGKISEEDDTYMVRQELLPREWEYDPLAIKWLIHVPRPQREDGLSDLDRLTRAIQLQWGKREVRTTLRVLRGIAAAVREEDGLVTVTLIRAEDKLHLVRIEAGDQTTSHFGIAIDVGTTTVAVQLVDLARAKILATRSSYNDQISCGLDVISRINYARKPERLEELRTRVLDTINKLLEQVARSCGTDPAVISNAVVSGNTIMIHLLLGMQPEHIRLDPYTPSLLEMPYLSAGEVGINMNPDAWVCFSPHSGSYVGGDITAGLLCTDLATDTDEVNLFIDIGTNGEMAVGNSDFLMSCACSAGPAFEGGGIGCGMRAAIGAIESVAIDADSGMPFCTTIGNTLPRGICGSGMIALIANLYTTGWLDQAGRLNREKQSDAILIDGKKASYILSSAERSATGEALVINEVDIDNIIRAKAAIYSASAMMLGQLELSFDSLEHIYVAGGFGRFLDLEKAITIGLLPDIPRERFCFVGNASLTGSYMVVVSQENRQRQLELARRMTYIDLSTDPAYMDQYTGALFIPHTDPTLFPSVSLRHGANHG